MDYMRFKDLLKVTWLLNSEVTLTKDNLAKKIGGRQTLLFLSAMHNRESNIFSLAVLLRVLFGDMRYLLLMSPTS